MVKSVPSPVYFLGLLCHAPDLMVNLLSGRCGCPAVSTHRETLRARSIVNRIEVPVVGMPYAETAARHVAPLYLAFAAPVLGKLDVDEVKVSWSSEVCD